MIRFLKNGWKIVVWPNSIISKDIKTDENLVKLYTYKWEDEKKELEYLLKAQRKRFRNDPAAATKLLSVGQAALSSKTDRSELAAWTSICRVVLNLHETITRS